ncbi:MFS transporter [Kribbella sp. CA-293567]|uniref:MFS transporter n=1 Tax=Kribbella sp. CA-293567 TaxID=3002436 RepID=UPI0022DD72C5|nr:MFS transporter [Kribbella sp. CA-293567]WBQ06928.1 MFS transporter [Kribbella sp. CA-293567]
MNTTTNGSWRELLGRTYAPVAVVLAGGVLMEASTVYLTTSLLPTIVGDIGGAGFYAWTMTAFLVASVISSMLVSRILTTRGSMIAYLLAFGLFGLGSLIAAASPGIGVFLAGRAVQGFGGGLLAGLGYALIQRALPERLWAKGAALVSAMWGVGNLVGPAAGGVFGQFGVWRPAFGLLVVLAAVLMIVVVRVLPRTERSASSSAVPGISLVLLTSAVAMVSVASIVPAGIATAATLIVGLGLGAVFVLHERTAKAAVLPRVTFAPGTALKWVYLTVGILAFGIGTEAFIPLFGQELGALSPLLAGFLGAALSLGWSLSQTVSASAERPAVVRRLVIGGPALLAVGLAAYAVLQQSGPSVLVVVLWFVTLFAAGAGIGIAFPHLAVAAFSSVGDEEEASKASAGINTVFLMASAFSAALAGVLVKLGEPSVLSSARWLLFVFAAAALIGAFPAWRITRSRAARQTEEPQLTH